MKEQNLVNRQNISAAISAGQTEIVTWSGVSRHHELKQVTRVSGAAEYILVPSDTEDVSALDHFVRAAEQIEFVTRLMKQKANGETISALNWDWNSLQEFYEKAQNAAWFSARILNRLCLENGCGYLLADLTKYQTCPDDKREWRTLTATAVDQLSDEINSVMAHFERVREKREPYEDAM